MVDVDFSPRPSVDGTHSYPRLTARTHTLGRRHTTHRSAPRPSPLWYDSPMATDPQTERPEPARTAALVSVGCKVNQGELRQWGVSLARVGVKLVAPGQPADLAIVNTCTVTGEGDKSSRQAIR